MFWHSCWCFLWIDDWVGFAILFFQYSFYTCRVLHILIYTLPSFQYSFYNPLIQSIRVGSSLCLFMFIWCSRTFDPACFIGWECRDGRCVLVISIWLVWADVRLCFVFVFDVWCYIVYYTIYYILYYTLLFLILFPLFFSSSDLSPPSPPSSSSFLPHSLLSWSSPFPFRISFKVYVSVVTHGYLYSIPIFPKFWPRMFYRSGWLRCVVRICVLVLGWVWAGVDVWCILLYILLLYYYILYYILYIHILLLYLILYSSSVLPLLSSSPLIYLPLLFCSHLSSSSSLLLLFRSLPNILSLLPFLCSFSSIYSPLSSSSSDLSSVLLPFSPSSHSKYTCRVLHNLIYIHNHSHPFPPNLTPHVLSDGNVEWCSFSVCGVLFLVYVLSWCWR